MIIELILLDRLNERLGTVCYHFDFKMVLIFVCSH